MRSSLDVTTRPIIRYRVLIVDDSPADIDSVARCLMQTRLHEFVVSTARSMQDGLDSVVTLKPDCVVLDYVLGGTTALEFLEELRARGDSTPVVAISGTVSRAVGTLIRAGAFEFVLKEDIHEHLAAVVLDAINQRANAPIAANARSSENVGLRLAVERASYLAMASKRLSAVTEHESLVDVILELALSLFGDVAIIDFVEERATTARQVRFSANAPYRSDTPQLWSAPPASAEDGPRHVMRHGLPRYYNRNDLAGLALIDSDIAHLRALSLRTLGIVPLSSHSTLFGTLSLGSSELEHITVERRAVLEEFAQRAGLAIENAQNVRAARDALGVANAARRRLNFQAQVSSLLVKSLDWRETLQTLTQRLSAFLSDWAAIHLDNGEDGVFHFGARAAAAHTDAWPLKADAAVHSAIAATEFEFSDFALTVPLGNHIKQFGVVVLTRELTRVPFSHDDATLAEDLGRRISAYLENAWTFEREKGIATTLQNSLFIKALPRVEGFEIASRYFAGAPGMEVGGDWYDIVPLEDGRIAVALGDVSGRGVLAAAVMGQLRNLLRAYAFEGHSPGNALMRVNELMNTMPAETFATIIYAIIDQRAQTIQYASAGHLPAIVGHPDGSVTLLDRGRSLPVGVVNDFELHEELASFLPGSTLLLYTDGLVETKERGVEEGIDKAVKTLEQSARSPEIMAGILLDAMVTHRTDDIALLAIRFSDPACASRRTWTTPALDSKSASALRIEVTAFLRTFVAESAALYDSSIIVGELLSNVARYAPGRVELEIDWTAAYPIFHVKDYGRGFDTESARKPLADFDNVNGRGLFLISELGRDVVFAAQAGEGTYGRVTLPIKRDVPAPSTHLR